MSRAERCRGQAAIVPYMASIGGFFEGLARFIATWSGWAGNTFRESKALREEMAKQREAATEETRESS